MVDYGQNKKYVVSMQKIDYYPDLAGIKLSSIPPILAGSICPLWFDQLFLSISALVSLSWFALIAARREDEGCPLLLNHYVIKTIAKLPKNLAYLLVPSIAGIIHHNNEYRR